MQKKYRRGLNHPSTCIDIYKYINVYLRPTIRANGPLSLDKETIHEEKTLSTHRLFNLSLCDTAE